MTGFIKPAIGATFDYFRRHIIGHNCFFSGALNPNSTSRCFVSSDKLGSIARKHRSSVGGGPQSPTHDRGWQDQQPSRRRYPCRGDPRWCQLAQQPWTGGAQQYHFVSAAALQPGAQSSGADLALSAQPLARQLGISQPGGHHGCLRDGVEPVRRRSRLDPLALRGRLGSGFLRSIAAACYRGLR
jgi:hypothetical protein